MKKGPFIEGIRAFENDPENERHGNEGDIESDLQKFASEYAEEKKRKEEQALLDLRRIDTNPDVRPWMLHDAVDRLKSVMKDLNTNERAWDIANDYRFIEKDKRILKAYLERITRAFITACVNTIKNYDEGMYNSLHSLDLSYDFYALLEEYEQEKRYSLINDAMAIVSGFRDDIRSGEKARDKYEAEIEELNKLRANF